MFADWKDVEPLVKGKRNALHEAFATRQEASNFVRNHKDHHVGAKQLDRNLAAMSPYMQMVPQPEAQRAAPNADASDKQPLQAQARRQQTQRTTRADVRRIMRENQIRLAKAVAALNDDQALDEDYIKGWQRPTKVYQRGSAASSLHPSPTMTQEFAHLRTVNPPRPRMPVH